MKTNPLKFKVSAGDLVTLDLNPTLGAEKSKIRPCFVLQDQITPLALITVLPITDASKNRPDEFFVTLKSFKSLGLKKLSVIDCYQIRTVSLNRIHQKLGCASYLLDEVRLKVKDLLEL